MFFLNKCKFYPLESPLTAAVKNQYGRRLLKGIFCFLSESATSGFQKQTLVEAAAPELGSPVGPVRPGHRALPAPLPDTPRVACPPALVGKEPLESGLSAAAVSGGVMRRLAPTHRIQTGPLATHTPFAPGSFRTRCKPPTLPPRKQRHPAGGDGRLRQLRVRAPFPQSG